MPRAIKRVETCCCASANHLPVEKLKAMGPREYLAGRKIKRAAAAKLAAQMLRIGIPHRIVCSQCIIPRASVRRYGENACFRREKSGRCRRGWQWETVLNQPELPAMARSIHRWWHGEIPATGRDRWFYARVNERPIRAPVGHLRSSRCCYRESPGYAATPAAGPSIGAHQTHPGAAAGGPEK